MKCGAFVLLFLALRAIDGLSALNLGHSLLGSSTPDRRTSSNIGLGVGLSKEDGLTLTKTDTRQEHTREYSQVDSNGKTINQDGNSFAQTDIEHRRSEEIERNTSEQNAQSLSLLGQHGLLQSRQSSRRTGDETRTTDEYNREHFIGHDQNGGHTHDIDSIDESGNRQQKKTFYDEESSSSLGLGQGGLGSSQAGSKSYKNSEANTAFNRNQRTEEEIIRNAGSTTRRKTTSNANDQSEHIQETSGYTSFSQGQSNPGLLNSGPQAGQGQYNVKRTITKSESPIIHRSQIRQPSFTPLPNYGAPEIRINNQQENYASDNGIIIEDIAGPNDYIGNADRESEQILSKHGLRTNQYNDGTADNFDRNYGIDTSQQLSRSGFQGFDNSDYYRDRYPESRRVENIKYVPKNRNQGLDRSGYQNSHDYLTGVLNRGRNPITYPNGPRIQRTNTGKYVNRNFVPANNPGLFPKGNDEEDEDAKLSEILATAQSLLKHKTEYGQPIFGPSYETGPVQYIQPKRPEYVTPNQGIRYYDATGHYMGNPSSPEVNIEDGEGNYEDNAPGYTVSQIPASNGYISRQDYGPDSYRNSGYDSRSIYVPGTDGRNPTTIFGSNPNIINGVGPVLTGRTIPINGNKDKSPAIIREPFQSKKYYESGTNIDNDGTMKDDIIQTNNRNGPVDDGETGKHIIVPYTNEPISTQDNGNNKNTPDNLPAKIKDIIGKNDDDIIVNEKFIKTSKPVALDKIDTGKGKLVGKITENLRKGDNDNDDSVTVNEIINPIHKTTVKDKYPEIEFNEKTEIGQQIKEILGKDIKGRLQRNGKPVVVNQSKLIKKPAKDGRDTDKAREIGTEIGKVRKIVDDVEISKRSKTLTVIGKPVDKTTMTKGIYPNVKDNDKTGNNFKEIKRILGKDNDYTIDKIGEANSLEVLDIDKTTTIEGTYRHVKDNEKAGNLVKTFKATLGKGDNDDDDIVIIDKSGNPVVMDKPKAIENINKDEIGKKIDDSPINRIDKLDNIDLIKINKTTTIEGTYTDVKDNGKPDKLVKTFKATLGKGDNDDDDIVIIDKSGNPVVMDKSKAIENTNKDENDQKIDDSPIYRIDKLDNIDLIEIDKTTTIEGTYTDVKDNGKADNLVKTFKAALGKGDNDEDDLVIIDKSSNLVVIDKPKAKENANKEETGKNSKGIFGKDYTIDEFDSLDLVDIDKTSTIEGTYTDLKNDDKAENFVKTFKATLRKGDNDDDDIVIIDNSDKPVVTDKTIVIEDTDGRNDVRTEKLADISGKSDDDYEIALINENGTLVMKVKPEDNIDKGEKKKKIKETSRQDVDDIAKIDKNGNRAAIDKTNVVETIDDDGTNINGKQVVINNSKLIKNTKNDEISKNIKESLGKDYDDDVVDKTGKPIVLDETKVKEETNTDGEDAAKTGKLVKKVIDTSGNGHDNYDVAIIDENGILVMNIEPEVMSNMDNDEINKKIIETLTNGEHEHDDIVIINKNGKPVVIDKTKVIKKPRNENDADNPGNKDINKMPQVIKDCNDNDDISIIKNDQPVTDKILRTTISNKDDSSLKYDDNNGIDDGGSSKDLELSKTFADRPNNSDEPGPKFNDDDGILRNGQPVTDNILRSKNYIEDSSIPKDWDDEENSDRPSFEYTDDDKILLRENQGDYGDRENKKENEKENDIGDVNRNDDTTTETNIKTFTIPDNGKRDNPSTENDNDDLKDNDTNSGKDGPGPDSEDEKTEDDKNGINDLNETKKDKNKTDFNPETKTDIENSDIKKPERQESDKSDLSYEPSFDSSENCDDNHDDSDNNHKEIIPESRNKDELEKEKLSIVGENLKAISPNNDYRDDSTISKPESELSKNDKTSPNVGINPDDNDGTGKPITDLAAETSPEDFDLHDGVSDNDTVTKPSNAGGKDDKPLNDKPDSDGGITQLSKPDRNGLNETKYSETDETSPYEALEKAGDKSGKKPSEIVIIIDDENDQSVSNNDSTNNKGGKNKLATVKITIQSKSKQSKLNDNRDGNNVAGGNKETGSTGDESKNNEIKTKSNEKTNDSDTTKNNGSIGTTNIELAKTGSNDNTNISDTTKIGPTTNNEIAKTEPNNDSNKNTSSDNKETSTESNDKTKSDETKTRKEESSKTSTSDGYATEEESKIKSGGTTTYIKKSDENEQNKEEDKFKFTEETNGSKGKTVESGYKNSLEESNKNTSENYKEVTDDKGNKNTRKDSSNSEDEKKKEDSGTGTKTVDSKGNVKESNTSSSNIMESSKNSSTTVEEYTTVEKNGA